MHKLIIAQVMEQVLSFHEYHLYKRITLKKVRVLSCLIILCIRKQVTFITLCFTYGV